MGISAADVKNLREATGVGMMKCKAALSEAEGDYDKAVEILRTKGQATAEKRSGKTAAEGKVLTRVKDGLAVNLEVNSETDFVSRNEDFDALMTSIADVILERRPAGIEELEGLEIPGEGKDVAALVQQKTADFGEKIVVRRFQLVEAGEGFVQDYLHMGGRIGVLVHMTGADPGAEGLAEVARDVAMQVAAMRPQWVGASDVPEDELNKEREIQKQRALEEGKPEKMVDKIAEGRMRKFFSEVCLLEQPFVKEQKKSVREVLASFSKDLTLTSFSRFEVGEGL